MNTNTPQVKDPNDPTFLKLWSDLYNGIENNLENEWLMELAYMAGYSHCAEDLINMVKSTQPNQITNNITNGNEIE